MGQAKSRKVEIEALKAASFPQDKVSSWERNLCVPFAVALARKTGWLLHVDWAVDDLDASKARVRVPLRAYVGTDKDEVFDVRGISDISRFNQSTVRPLASAIRPPAGARQMIVNTRAYDDKDLTKLNGDGVSVSECDIDAALATIEATPAYLARIPPRAAPTLPAKAAYDFAFGACVIYAEALRQARNLPAVAMMCEQMDTQWSTKRPQENGYMHSFLLHPDGTGEDSWGRHQLADIARRYHLTSWRLDGNVQGQVVTKLREGNPKLFEEGLARAKELIAGYG